MHASTLTIIHNDVPLTIEVEYDPGEPAIYWPFDSAHPGAPGEAILMSCKAGGIDIYPLLDSDTVTAIETRAAAEMEAA